MGKVDGVDAHESDRVKTEAKDGCFDQQAAGLACLDKIHDVSTCFEELAGTFFPEAGRSFGSTWCHRVV